MTDVIVYTDQAGRVTALKIDDEFRVDGFEERDAQDLVTCEVCEDLYDGKDQTAEQHAEEAHDDGDE